MMYTVANLDKLQAMLDEVQTKRIKARTITVTRIQDALHSMSDMLSRISTTKDALGTRVEVDLNAQVLPRAYTHKSSAESTWFDATLQANGWKVTRIYRYRTLQCNGRNCDIFLTKATKENMAQFVADHVSL